VTLLDGELHPIERQLVGELGDNDPAASQADSLALWPELVRAAGKLIRVRPAEGEWSAADVLAHLTAVELTNGLRYRAMLVEDVPFLSDYDAAAWTPLLRRSDADMPGLLALFGALRRSNLEMWAQLGEIARARTGIHRECGPETIELRFRMLAGHDRMHLGQAERAIETARRRP
jgi:hypothetical protein